MGQSVNALARLLRRFLMAVDLNVDVLDLTWWLNQLIKNQPSAMSLTWGLEKPGVYRR